MTTWTDIANSAVDQDSPFTQPLLTLLRDNPIAALEGATGAPVNAYAWHPYDMVDIGDGNDGVFWDQAVDGTSSSETTPAFAEGYDYLIWGRDLSSDGTDPRITIDYSTDGNVIVANQLVNFNAGGDIGEFIMTIRSPKTNGQVWWLEYMSYAHNHADAANAPDEGKLILSRNTAQTIDTITIDFALGTGFDAGTLRMLRRVNAEHK